MVKAWTVAKLRGCLGSFAGSARGPGHVDSHQPPEVPTLLEARDFAEGDFKMRGMQRTRRLPLSDKLPKLWVT